jgi:hypothetical protein
MMILRMIVMTMAMFCIFGELAANFHADLCRANPAPIDWTHRKLSPKAERFGRIPQEFHRDARIDECAEQHISANTGKAFQISNAHA